MTELFGNVESEGNSTTALLLLVSEGSTVDIYTIVFVRENVRDGFDLSLLTDSVVEILDEVPHDLMSWRDRNAHSSVRKERS